MFASILYHINKHSSVHTFIYQSKRCWLGLFARMNSGCNFLILDMRKNGFDQYLLLFFLSIFDLVTKWISDDSKRMRGENWNVRYAGGNRIKEGRIYSFLIYRWKIDCSIFFILNSLDAFLGNLLFDIIGSSLTSFLISSNILRNFASSDVFLSVFFPFYF